MVTADDTTWMPRRAGAKTLWERHLGGKAKATVQRDEERGIWLWSVYRSDTDKAGGDAISQVGACLAADAWIGGKGSAAPTPPNPIPDLMRELRAFLMTWTVDPIQVKERRTKPEQARYAEATDLVDRIDEVVENRRWAQ